MTPIPNRILQFLQRGFSLEGHTLLLVQAPRGGGGCLGLSHTFGLFSIHFPLIHKHRGGGDWSCHVSRKECSCKGRCKGLWPLRRNGDFAALDLTYVFRSFNKGSHLTHDPPNCDPIETGVELRLCFDNQIIVLTMQ